MTKEAVTIQTSEDVLLQKYRFSLFCSGNAMILFAVWTIIRSIIQFNSQSDISMDNALIMNMLLLILPVGIIDVILKLIIGFSARSEALGKQKGNAYIVLGIILAALAIISVLNWFSLAPLFYQTDGLLGVIVSIAVDITVLIAELDLVISAIKIRKIEKEMGIKNSEEGRAR